MAGDKRNDGDWTVYDTLAREIDEKTQETKSRVHAAREGKNYKLSNDKPCFMPESDARVFLKDSAFVVLNENDEVVPALNAQALDRKLPERLAANLVIADLNELTAEALVTRAAQKLGGQRFSLDTRREALIRFLTDGNVEHERAVAPQRQIPQDAGDEGDVEEMEEGDPSVAKMLEGA
jgi:hypothetical protein